MYICDNAKCKIWLHKQCLIDHALKKELGKLSIGSKVIKTEFKGKPSKSTKAKPYAGILSGSIEELKG